MVPAPVSWTSLLREVARYGLQAAVNVGSGYACPSPAACPQPVCNVTVERVTCVAIEVPSLGLLFWVLLLVALIVGLLIGWTLASCSASRAVDRQRRLAQEQTLRARNYGLPGW